MNCTFFGHADAPSEVKSKLREEVIKLIENRGADRFYVGNHGSFDRMALAVLKELSEVYPQIDYCVVYAYLPQDCEDFLHTVYPEGIENVPKRFAINFRNNWMIRHADIVITFVRNSFGNAAKFKNAAEKHGREIVEI
ncbi:MAG: DUF1273 domain-containing protein [Oscillospiraceae bacterium]|nr:DUF1273 domain-containing protein [Oscillospiraceae bacterium]